MKQISECTVDELRSYLDDLVSLRRQFNDRVKDITQDEFYLSSIVYTEGSSVYPDPDDYGSQIPGIQCADVRPIAEKLELETFVVADEYFTEMSKILRYILYDDIAFFSIHDVEEEETANEV